MKRSHVETAAISQPTLWVALNQMNPALRQIIEGIGTTTTPQSPLIEPLTVGAPAPLQAHSTKPTPSKPSHLPHQQPLLIPTPSSSSSAGQLQDNLNFSRRSSHWADAAASKCSRSLVRPPQSLQSQEAVLRPFRKTLRLMQWSMSPLRPPSSLFQESYKASLAPPFWRAIWILSPP